MSKWIKVGSNALETWSEERGRSSRIFKNTLKIQRMKPLKPKRNLTSSSNNEEEEE